MIAAALRVLALAALPLLVAAQGPAALPADCARNYTVVAGDTCDAISAAHNASTYQLATVNSPAVDDRCSNLGVGQTICLGTLGADCATTYTVVPGDTCIGVAQAAGINTTVLYANNPRIDAGCTNIYIGQVLCTLDSVRVPPAPAGSPTTPVVPAPGTATAATAQAQTPADLPWCDDPNDDGEW